MKKVILGAISLFLLGMFGSAFAAVPSEYYSNYRINDSWQNILDTLIKVEAYKKTGTDVPTSVFAKINTDFKKVFDYLPQNPNYRIVYEQCILTSSKLSAKFTYGDFMLFRDRCSEPINNVIKEIQSKYSVKATIKASPDSGSAPLNVTLDARGTSDPSNDTIPSSNYFWYYRDVNGNAVVIGRGPVMNYTFNDAGNYVVHLTVRSVNNSSKGVFDADSIVNVNVGPKAAVLSVHIGGKKMQKEQYVKIGTKDAENGVIVDGAGSYPTGGRKILAHSWTIDGPGSYKYTKSGNGNPGAFRIKLPGKGEYSLTIKIKDNENNEMTETYPFMVSDPIATIKSTPIDGNTSVTYNFDASLSYSIDSRIKSYKWNIFDPNGNSIEVFEGKSFQKKFQYPGNYTLRLSVTDELGNANDDQMKLYVDSTSPIPQYQIKSVKDRKNPSEFILDAGSSYDLDEVNGYDNMSFEWKFSNEKSVEILKTYDNNKKILVAFNDPGDYAVKLIVTDKYNKISEIEKTIKVESSLRPEIFVNPISVRWGETINFSASANKTTTYYKWEFGDDNVKEGSLAKVNHVYKQGGVYRVKLTAMTPGGEQNEITTNVFVGEKGYPIGAYKVRDGESILTQDEICSVKEGDKTMDYPAYSIDRYKDFVLDASDSVNSKGESIRSLKISMKPQNDEIFTTSNKQYKFSDQGCQYIELWAEDTEVRKIDNKKIWFKVKNALPTMDNLRISFPQYGNEMGVGMNQGANENKIQDSFSVAFDPLVVRVTVDGAKDVDSGISHYVWYYYKSDDPTRLLEVKVTPNVVPYAVFALPKIPGRFNFGVKIVDTDGGETKSEDVIGNGPSVFFLPDTKNPDIPLVTLQESKLNAKVGEEVEFKVSAKILSEKSDFNNERIIKYDFDGDGIDDLTTKKDKVTHIFQKAGNYRPKVKVIYRGYAGRDFGEQIQVTKGLKAQFMYDTFDKDVIVRNVSFGEIDKSDLCMDLKKCKDDKKYLKQDQDYFDFRYGDYGKYISLLKLSDEYGNNETYKQDITISKDKTSKDEVKVLSVPNIENTNDINEISVGNNLKNSVLFKILFNGTGTCYMDTDITNDTDGDGTPDNDKDLQCNKLGMVTYTPMVESTVARVFYGSGGAKTQDIKINFMDVEVTLSEKDKANYDKISALIGKIKGDDKDLAYLKTLLMNLRNSIGDKSAVDSVLVEINDFIENNLSKLSSDMVDEISSVIDGMKDESSTAAMGGTDYETAKIGILNLMTNDDLKSQVTKLFESIEQSGTQPDQIKLFLQQIVNLSQDEVKKGNLGEDDMNKITQNVCVILGYYSIPSKTCGTMPTSVEEVNQNTGSDTVLWKVMKVVFWVVGILLVVFVGLIVLFAIKAKRNQQKEVLQTPAPKQ